MEGRRKVTFFVAQFKIFSNTEFTCLANTLPSEFVSMNGGKKEAICEEESLGPLIGHAS